jgi:hypothetical protein
MQTPGANPVAADFEMPEWKVRGSWPGSFHEASAELHGGFILNEMQFSRELPPRRGSLFHNR